MAGNKPDYNLTTYDKITRNRGTVGFAWIGEGDRITIKLIPGIALTPGPDIVLTLFPNDDRGSGLRRPAVYQPDEPVDVPPAEPPF